MKIKDLCTYAPKSHLKAGQAIEGAEYMFFTSSSDESKRYNDYQFDCEGIIMGTGGNATLHYYCGKFSTSTDCVVLLPKDIIRCKYLYYFFLNNMSILEAGFKGASLKHTNKNHIDSIEILFIPSLNEQDKVIEVLDKICNVIDNKKEELNKLDNLIKARFVELFGDRSKYKFEPLYNNVEEMFIGPFGSSLKNEYFVNKKDSYCMVYEQKHAIQKTMNLPTRFVDEKKYNELKRFTVHGGDIIVSCRGTIGEIYSIPENAPMGIMHPSIMKIRLKKDKYCNLFFVLMLEQYMKDSISRAKGSGVKMAVTATELGKELFVVPEIEEQIEFERFIKQVDKSKLAVRQSLEKMQQLYNSLMQEYFG